MGYAAYETLEQHELAAMVHLVFLHAEDHLEAGLGGRRHARRELNTLTQKLV
jgi:hypothetical protein